MTVFLLTISVLTVTFSGFFIRRVSFVTVTLSMVSFRRFRFNIFALDIPIHDGYVLAGFALMGAVHGFVSVNTTCVSRSFNSTISFLRSCF